MLYSKSVDKKEKVKVYLEYASAVTKILEAIAMESAVKARRELVYIRRAAEKILQGKIKEQRTAFITIYNGGRRLSRLADGLMPELKKVVRNPRHFLNRPEAPPVLKQAQKDLPIINKDFKKMTGELADGTPATLHVNGELIKPGSNSNIIRIFKLASRKGERPSVQLNFSAPPSSKVTIKFEHEYDSSFFHKMAGTEDGKLTVLGEKCGLKETKYGEWQLVIPESRKASLSFSTRGFSAIHKFKCVIAENEPLYFYMDIDYNAYEFIRIPYKGDHYKGYGNKSASFGLIELKYFIEKFARLHHVETEFKPQIGNKSVKEGVRYYPHNGVSHASGYAVDIRIRPACTSYSIDSDDYKVDKHIEQIERYFKCGARYVGTSSEKVERHFRGSGKKVEKLDGHKSHDHVNVRLKQRI